MAAHDLTGLGSSTGTMILHHIILEPIGSHLVTPLTRTHLLPTILGLRLCGCALQLCQHTFGYGCASLGPAVLTTAALGCGRDARGSMPYATAILMLVAVLSSSTGARIPFHI
jgi:hypothetical protein